MKKQKKMTREQLAEAFAKAMNLLNDIDRDGFDNKQLGTFHELADLMPECVEYANNGTVFGREL